ncbi:MAG: ribonuclease HII [Candidatus Dojkabacteria bacterium]|jgi:ribonuclease HII
MVFPDSKIEQGLWQKGYKTVVGLDEAGRGPLAGPVVASAVVISNIDEIVPTVRDSKKMTEKQRNEAYGMIKEKSYSYGLGIVSSGDIDSMGIQQAVLKAMTIALEVVERKLNAKADYIIADGLNILDIPNYKMKKFKEGDLHHYSIAAASVLAKVTRDSIMREYHKKYEAYGFDTHVGYGTKKHMEAIKKYGICDIHRKSFKPICNIT